MSLDGSKFNSAHQEPETTVLAQAAVHSVFSITKDGF